MKKFKDLEFKSHPFYPNDGIISRMMFKNDYGVSVIKTPNSYGGRIGLYELAVLDRNQNITYNTSITDSVCGYLSINDVDEIMEAIQKL